ncbi:hypothetical protein HK102_002095, partial [Quaeritorhiza haematococci]
MSSSENNTLPAAAPASTTTKTRKRKWDVTDSSEPDSQKIRTRDTSSLFPAVSQQQPDTNGKSKDAKDLAAEAALRINAMLAARGVPVKPVIPVVGASSTSGAESTGSSSPGTPASSATTPISSSEVKGAAKEKKEEFFKDIEINDVKNRYLLTKGATQVKIKEDTGADVITRGRFYPDKSLATEKDPPLYLHVVAQTQESLDQAVEQINELIEQASVPLVEPRYQERQSAPPQRQFFSEKVFVGIEPDRTFNVRAKLVGPQGQYVKHIQNQTNTRVQLKGRGSGFIEHHSGTEAAEALHIHVTGTSQEAVDNAKKLCEDLIDTVKAEYEEMKKQRPPPMYHRGPPPPRSYNPYNPPPPPPPAGPYPPPPPP